MCNDDWEPPDDLPVWSNGSLLWTGDRMSARGFKLADPDEAKEAARCIRAQFSDAIGREVSGRAASLVQRYGEADEFEAAVRAAHSDGLTLGQWVLRLVQVALEMPVTVSKEANQATDRASTLIAPGGNVLNAKKDKK